MGIPMLVMGFGQLASGFSVLSTALKDFSLSTVFVDGLAAATTRLTGTTVANTAALQAEALAEKEAAFNKAQLALTCELLASQQGLNVAEAYALAGAYLVEGTAENALKVSKKELIIALMLVAAGKAANTKEAFALMAAQAAETGTTLGLAAAFRALTVAMLTNPAT